MAKKEINVDELRIIVEEMRENPYKLAEFCVDGDVETGKDIIKYVYNMKGYAKFSNKHVRLAVAGLVCGVKNEATTFLSERKVSNSVIQLLSSTVTSAQDKFNNITNSLKKVMISAHPDKNEGTEESKETFAILADLYKQMEEMNKMINSQPNRLIKDDKEEEIKAEEPKVKEQSKEVAIEEQL